MPHRRLEVTDADRRAGGVISARERAGRECAGREHAGDDPERGAHDLAGDDEARDGRSTRWDPHRRERRQAIIAAAVRAIELYGPDALTGQIAELAGLPRTHVYRHFDGKPSLDRAVSSEVSNQLGARLRAALSVNGTPRQLIRSAVDEHLAWIEDHPNLYRFLAQHAWLVQTAGSARADDAKAVFAQELTALIGGYLRALGVTDGPSEQVIVGVVGLVDATAAWWLERRGAARAELADELTEEVWLLLERGADHLQIKIDPDQALPAL